jgi:hypothetical protein
MMASDDGVLIGLGFGLLGFVVLWGLMWFASKWWR